MLASLSAFNFQIKMAESSSPEAKNWPDGDHLTTLTGFVCRVKSDANSNCGNPSSFSLKYQIYSKHRRYQIVMKKTRLKLSTKRMASQ